MSDFAHLHLHTQGSILDGLIQPERSMRLLAEQGATHCAATDHGNLSYIRAMAKAASEHGVTFVPGMEIYLSIGSRHERNHMLVPPEEDYDGGGGSEGAGKKKLYEHLTMLAPSRAGWRSLMALDFESRSTFYSKPRADFDLLAEHSEGIVVGTGCLGGPVAGALLRGDGDAAQSALSRLVEIYGRDNVFVEVMDHGIAAERKVIPELVALARRFGLLVVATNDAHYEQAGDADAHDAWLAIGESKQKKRTVLVTDPKRFRFQGSGYHLRTAQEMHALFDDQPGTGDAVRNSMVFAERAEPDIVLGSIPDGFKLVDYPVPEGFSRLEDYFHDRFRRGLVARYGPVLSPEVKKAARFEEDTFVAMGMCAYMLTVADILDEFRAAGIRVLAGRGSGVGSLNAYALGITNVEPLSRGLRFERFLNPARRTMPDLDIDIQASRQEEAMEIVRRRYGSDRVARIGTFTQDWAKASLKKIGRVTGEDRRANELAALVPSAGTASATRLSILTARGGSTGSELREAIERDPAAARMVAAAQAIEGNPSALSKHACGLVISPEPLLNHLPLRLSNNDDPDSMPVTQWDGKEVERAGFTKFDFLGIVDADVVDLATKFIEQDTGEIIDPDALNPDEDSDRARAAYDMMCAGRTAGLFQIAGSGIKELVVGSRPRCHADLALILALYRPGPMGGGMHDMYVQRKGGHAAVDYSIYSRNPDEVAVIASVLDETYGLIAYQEQMMALAEVIADFTPSQRYDLQRAISKKAPKDIAALRPLWMTNGAKGSRADGSAKVAFRESTLTELWRVFEASGDYSFNASHTYGYAVTTYVMAYLKANWPAHFSAALLAVTDKTAKEKRNKVLADIRAEGVPVRNPDVNSSGFSTGVHDGAVIFGLSEIRDVGEEARKIVAERDSNGPFVSAADLASRTGVGGSVISALAEAGALDAFGPRLGTVMAARALSCGAAVPDAEWGVVERAARERARLGVVVGVHPMEAVRDQVAAATEPVLRGAPLSEIGDLPPVAFATVAVAGVVASVEERNRGRGMAAHLVLESPTASVEVTLWPERYRSVLAAHGPIVAGSVVGVSGQVRVFTPPEPEDGTEERPSDPIVKIYGDRLFGIELNDPPTRPGPAPGAVTELEVRGASQAVLLELAPNLDPERVEREEVEEPTVESVPSVAGLIHLVVRPSTGHLPRTPVTDLRFDIRNELSRLFPALEGLPIIPVDTAEGSVVAELASTRIPGLRLVIVTGEHLNVAEFVDWKCSHQVA